MVRSWDSYDDARQRMIEETGWFITWGLRNPDKVRWIPRRPDGEGGFSLRATFVFWTPLLGDSFRRPISWLRSLLKR